MRLTKSALRVLLVTALVLIPLISPLCGVNASASTFNKSQWEQSAYKHLSSFQNTYDDLSQAAQYNEISLEYTLAGKIMGEGNGISYLAHTPNSSLNAEMKLLGETIYSWGENLITLVADIESDTSTSNVSTRRMSTQVKTIKLLFKEVTGSKL